MQNQYPSKIIVPADLRDIKKLVKKKVLKANQSMPLIYKLEIHFYLFTYVNVKISKHFEYCFSGM